MRKEKNMYGAFIGDIVGSKYEFHNIKTKDFPLLSEGCDFTDDTIMTVAVAEAIMRSQEEQFHGGKRSFREILIKTMQEYGRKYPNPTGAYGGHFAQWLRQDDPKPYGSFGNGSAMRVSPCGLAAVDLEEAVSLARASAVVSHNHPEGIRGAEAVAAAVFLAKTGHSKPSIREYIERHYYKLNFTLDGIRGSYGFDGSCQGSVPQAIVAFLESNSFEDAIRNAISIGGDCDTTGAITGSIAWTYYMVQAGPHVMFPAKFDENMLVIKESIRPYLTDEFADIADRFHELCQRRADTKKRTGACTPILSKAEELELHANWNSPFQAPVRESHLTPEIEEEVLRLCRKYIVLMECLFKDKELNKWCREYSTYQAIETHAYLRELIYQGFMKEAYAAYDSRLLPTVIGWDLFHAYSYEKAISGSKEDIIYGICMEIRGDYGTNGSLIYHSIGSGSLYKLMDALLNFDSGVTKKPKEEAPAPASFLMKQGV